MGSGPLRCCIFSFRIAPDDVRYGTSGMPVPGYDALVLDEQGAPVADGEAGSSWCAGHRRPRGIGIQRDKTRRTFRGEWTHTGTLYP